MKICTVRAEMFHAEGRRKGMTKPIAGFRNFSKAPKGIKSGPAFL